MQSVLLDGGAWEDFDRGQSGEAKLASQPDVLPLQRSAGDARAPSGLLPFHGELVGENNAKMQLASGPCAVTSLREHSGVVVEIKAAGAGDAQGSMELASAAHVVDSMEGAELADF